MPDREKVVSGLKHCLFDHAALDILDVTNHCNGCPYYTSPECERDLYYDALELLKTMGLVIRCKDCRWWQDGRCANDYVHQQMNDDEYYPDFHTDSEWFCAEGERR